MTTRTSKRQRFSDSEDEKDELAIIRSSIWAEDRRVVIQAEQTQFCVHRSLLATNSPILKERLEDVPELDPDGVDGIPVLHLCDTAKDMEHLLHALSDSNYYLQTETEAYQSFEQFSALLRLGLKYQISCLRDGAIQCFHSPGLRVSREAQPWRVPMAEYNFYIDVVNLAREHNILSVLPHAFLCCSILLSTKEIVMGTLRTDGSRAILSPQDQVICLSGLDLLRSAHVERVSDWLTEVSVRFVGCTNRSVCSKMKANAAVHMAKLPSTPSGLDFCYSQNLCQACQRVSDAWSNQTRDRRSLWKMYPSFFGFPLEHNLQPIRDI